MSHPNGASIRTGHPVSVEPPGRDAARALLAARRAEAARGGATASTPFGSSPVALGFYRRRRLLVVLLAAVLAAILLLSAWAVGDRDVLSDQLESFTLALLGVYFAGVAALAFWAHQRRRELVRLTDVEQYVVAVAQRLGLGAEALPGHRREHG